jgi:ankyrin repeat protein
MPEPIVCAILATSLASGLTDKALETVSGLGTGMGATWLSGKAFQKKAHLAQRFREGGSPPENEHIERHAYRAHLGAAERMLLTLYPVAEQARAIAMSPDYVCYNKLLKSIQADLKAMKNGKWPKGLSIAAQQEHNRKSLEAALGRLDKNDDGSSLTQAVIDTALDDLRARLDEGMTLPEQLVQRFNDEDRGYMTALSLYQADELKYGEEDLFRIFLITEVLEIRKDVKDLAGIGEKLATSLRKSVREEIRSEFDDITTSISKIGQQTGEILGHVQNIDDRHRLQHHLSILKYDDQQAGVKTSSFFDYRFESRRTEFIGRDEELRRISEFLSDERPFLWWQIAGDGGQGKSRLALTVVDRLSTVWQGGFLAKESLEAIDWNTIMVECPTLCVIDYIAAPRKNEALGSALAALHERLTKASAPFAKLRILVVERAPYAFERSSDKVSASWFERLRKTPRHEAAAIKYAFDRTPLMLEDLSDRAMISVANSWRASQDTALPPLAEEQEKLLIQFLDGGKDRDDADEKRRAWRPLFAMMFAANIPDKPELANRNIIPDLLDRTLKTEIEEWWNPQEPAEQARNLACLATIAGTLPLEHDGLDDDDFYRTGDDAILRQAWMCLGHAVEDPTILNKSHSAAIPLPARQPDLLGEYYVIWSLQAAVMGRRPDKKTAEALSRIMRDSWAISPDGTLAFLIRFYEDFPQHPLYKALANVRPGIAGEGTTLGMLSIAAYYGFGWVVADMVSMEQQPEDLSRPLLLAAHNGHAECVSVLLAAGADPNTLDEKSGAPPLLMAAQQGHAACVDRLLEAGADPNAINRKNGVFPILLAALGGHADCVSKLLEAGADPNAIRKKNGAFPLLVAAEQGHAACVDELLEAGADPNAIRKRNGAFPLLIAAKNGHVDCVASLLDGGADPNALHKKEGVFPLLIAAKNGHAACVASIIDAGADPNAIHEKSGVFPLLIAAQEGYVDCVGVLLGAGADANAVHEQDGAFPLLQATQEGHVDCVACLLDAGVDPNAINKMNGVFPLLKAAKNGHAECVSKLLAAGADPNTIDEKHGVFPLLIAAQNGHATSVERLLAVGADPNAAHAETGTSPLLLAAKNGHAECVRKLLEAGADPNNICEKSGAFPLLLAAQNGHVCCVGSLLEAGADANAVRPQDGIFPLLRAAQNGHVDCVGKLLEAGADANAVFVQDGTFSLLLAASNGHARCVESLIDAGADVNKIHGESSATPLLVAISNRHEACVQLLLEAGADVSVVYHHDEKAFRCLDLAKVRGDQKIIALLESYGAKTSDETDST